MLRRAATILTVMALVSACGGHRESQGDVSTQAPSAVALDASDLPDVLNPGIWTEQGPGLTASRDGSTITIKTGWTSYAPDDAVTVCGNAVLDLHEPGVIVQVMGGNSDDITLAWNKGSGKCHDLGNHS